LLNRLCSKKGIVKPILEFIVQKKRNDRQKPRTSRKAKSKGPGKDRGSVAHRTSEQSGEGRGLPPIAWPRTPGTKNKFKKQMLEAEGGPHNEN
jgi:hypothetical protein